MKLLLTRLSLSSCIIIFAIALMTTNAFAAPCQLPSRTQWINELGSKMELFSDNTGQLQGGYITAVGCGAGVRRPLVGFCNGFGMTFAVNFQECDSTTAWTGTLSANREIKTLWHLALGARPTAWNSIVAGADTFKQVINE